MCNWENVTELFSEDERHYKGTYMEINEVYDGKIDRTLYCLTVQKTPSLCWGLESRSPG